MGKKEEGHAMEITLGNLSNALATEKKAAAFQQSRLKELHEYYTPKLSELRDTASVLKKKISVLNKCSSPQELEAFVAKKHNLFQCLSLQSQDTMDRQKETLTNVLQSLQKQLQSLMQQYSHPQPKPQPSIKSNVQNPYYQQILKDNQKLQRQIEFLRAVIKSETQQK